MPTGAIAGIVIIAIIAVVAISTVIIIVIIRRGKKYQLSQVLMELILRSVKLIKSKCTSNHNFIADSRFSAT